MSGCQVDDDWSFAGCWKRRLRGAGKLEGAAVRGVGHDYWGRLARQFLVQSRRRIKPLLDPSIALFKAQRALRLPTLRHQKPLAHSTTVSSTNPRPHKCSLLPMLMTPERVHAMPCADCMRSTDAIPTYHWLRVSAMTHGRALLLRQRPLGIQICSGSPRLSRVTVAS